MHSFAKPRRPSASPPNAAHSNSILQYDDSWPAALVATHPFNFADGRFE